MQIYENLFRQEANQRNERGEIQFDQLGNLLESPTKGGIAALPTISAALRPLLEYVDGYRRRVAAPDDTIVRKKYSRYADLSYI